MESMRLMMVARRSANGGGDFNARQAGADSQSRTYGYRYDVRDSSIAIKDGD
jgi:hypothetical protein